VFVPHPRIAETASELGVRKVIVTGPGDEGLITGLSTYFNKA
jgi:uroporphyrinogen-III synthase